MADRGRPNIVRAAANAIKALSVTERSQKPEKIAERKRRRSVAEANRREGVFATPPFPVEIQKLRSGSSVGWSPVTVLNPEQGSNRNDELMNKVSPEYSVLEERQKLLLRREIAVGRGQALDMAAVRKLIELLSCGVETALHHWLKRLRYQDQERVLADIQGRHTKLLDMVDELEVQTAKQELVDCDLEPKAAPTNRQHSRAKPKEDHIVGNGEEEGSGSLIDRLDASFDSHDRAATSMENCQPLLKPIAVLDQALEEISERTRQNDRHRREVLDKQAPALLESMRHMKTGVDNLEQKLQALVPADPHHQSKEEENSNPRTDVGPKSRTLTLRQLNELPYEALMQQVATMQRFLLDLERSELGVFEIICLLQILVVPLESFQEVLIVDEQNLHELDGVINDAGNDLLKLMDRHNRMNRKLTAMAKEPAHEVKAECDGVEEEVRHVLEFL